MNWQYGRIIKTLYDRDKNPRVHGARTVDGAVRKRLHTSQHLQNLNFNGHKRQQTKYVYRYIQNIHQPVFVNVGVLEIIS